MAERHTPSSHLCASHFSPKKTVMFALASMMAALLGFASVGILLGLATSAVRFDAYRWGPRGRRKGVDEGVRRAEMGERFVAGRKMLHLVDLEHDHVDPFEATRFVNRIKVRKEPTKERQGVVPKGSKLTHDGPQVQELGLHVFHLLCVGYVQARFLFFWQLLFVLHQLWNLHRGRMYVEVTSIFKDLGAEKRKTGIRLGVYFVACVWTVFTLIRTAVGK